MDTPLNMFTVQKHIEEHYRKTKEAFVYDPNNPLFKYRITLMNGCSFEVIMTNMERWGIERTKYWTFISKISGLGPLIQ